MEFPELLRDVVQPQPSGAWLGVLTAIVLYAAKKLTDALLPKGWTFRFMERWLRRRDGDDEG